MWMYLCHPNKYQVFFLTMRLWGGDAILVSGHRQLQYCAYRHSDQESVVSISTFANTQLHAYTSHNVANLIYKHELLSSPSFFKWISIKISLGNFFKKKKNSKLKFLRTSHTNVYMWATMSPNFWKNEGFLFCKSWFLKLHQTDRLLQFSLHISQLSDYFMKHVIYSFLGNSPASEF